MRYDLHLHSALSPCGSDDMTPNNIVNMAALIGLDVIAITDHNTVGNARAAIEAAKELPLKVLPGMEIETVEGIHILTLYKTVEAAEAVAAWLYEKLPPIPNKPELFGHQYLMNADDEIVGEEERLLVSPTDASYEEVYEAVNSAGGLFIPAHVDRLSYSILTVFGAIPPEPDIRMIEISPRVELLEDYFCSRPDLKSYTVLRSSDAHYLEDIAKADQMEGCDIEAVLKQWLG